MLSVQYQTVLNVKGVFSLNDKTGGEKKLVLDVENLFFLCELRFIENIFSRPCVTRVALKIVIFLQYL